MGIARISRPIKSIAAILSLLAWLVSPAPVHAADPVSEGGYHRPDTPAELALDGLLLLAQADGDMGWFATGQKERDTRKDGRFARYFSARLVAAWRKAEAAELKRNCGGKYVEGDLCGLEVHPITCSQSDYPDGYHYRTERAGRDWAIISYRWPNNAETVATYRMTKSGSRWIIDGVACPGYMKFNME